MMGEVWWKEGILVMIWQRYFEAAEADEGTCEGNLRELQWSIQGDRSGA